MNEGEANLGRRIVIQEKVDREHEHDHHQTGPVVHDPLVLQVPVDDDFSDMHPKNRVHPTTAAHLTRKKKRKRS